MTVTPSPLGSPQQTPLTRRSVIRTGAWGAPVVSLAAAAPAFASSSTWELTPIITLPAPTLTACRPSPANAFQFRVTVDGQTAPAGTPVTFTLPEYLTFTDGSRTAIALVRADGSVDLPTVTATGAAGTYTVLASVGEGPGRANATLSIVVRPAVGQVVEIHRSIGDAGTAATFATQEVVGVLAAVGSIMGDQATTNSTTGGANAAVISGGSVRLWGRNIGAPTTAPLTLTHNGAAVTGTTLVGTWTSIAVGDNTTGGVTAGSRSGTNAVYQWFNDGTSSADLKVARVTGVTGTILRATSDRQRSYVATTTGLFSWATVTDGSDVAATQVLTTTAIADLDSYGYTWSGTTYVGGVVATSTAVWTLNASGATTPLTLPAGVTTVARVTRTSGTLMLLDGAGNLWSRGTASKDASTWTLRATDVASFSQWGFTDTYAGGLWITNAGTAFKFFATSAVGSTSWPAPEAVLTPAGAPLTGVTKTFSSDGTYMLLTSDGTVHLSGGNLDNKGRTHANPLTLATGGVPVEVSDLNVWGHRLGGSYYGGGYVLTNEGC